MGWVVSIVAVSLLAVAGVVLEGCGVSCNAVGYAEGFHLRIERPAWEPAEYRIEGEFDGQSFACRLDPLYRSSCEPAALSFGDDWWFGTTLVIQGEPKTVRAAVYQDDQFLGGGTFEPRYTRDEPNGDGCGKRVYASVTLELPGPAPCGVDSTCRCVYDDGCGCETDDLSVGFWDTCPVGAVHHDACVPGCACDSTPGTCVSDCSYTLGRRAVCDEGAWTCSDPAYPVPLANCGK